MLTTKDMGVSGVNNGQRFPGIGAIVNREVGPRKPGMPGYTASPHAASIGLAPGYFGGHLLGVQHNPFVTGDPNARELPGAQPEPRRGPDAREARRPQEPAEALRQPARRTWTRTPTAQAMDQFSHEAFEFVTGPTARQAFDIGKEPTRLRDSYGRDSWGQSTLLARRLVEAGSTFVTVHFGGWDHHWDLKAGYENYLPKVDRGRVRAVHRPGRPRAARHDAGGAVRRVQPDAEDERRRQRRPAAEAWAPRAATTGATRCSA